MEGKGLIIVTAVAMVALGLFVVSTIAQNAGSAPSGVPALPYVQWGELRVGSQLVKDGLVVEAFITGVPCGQPSTTKGGAYLAVVKGNCGSSSEVSISVNGVQIDKSAWSSGSVIKEDITLRPQDLKKDIREFVAEGR
ncbi:MAG: hypothetical protein HY518_05465 [Candidatus Aenigmarchaeota archaeon]|nr:hypothetical protein [Candidatus Aenigmarchaeota archaeon]